jgi:hypothetical protein
MFPTPDHSEVERRQCRYSRQLLVGQHYYCISAPDNDKTSFLRSPRIGDAPMPRAARLRASGTLNRAVTIAANPTPVNILAVDARGLPTRVLEVRLEGSLAIGRTHPQERASRRPAAFGPTLSRRKGRGRARAPEQVSPPDGSPTELLRAAPPHALAPSDTINRFVAFRPPGITE